MTDFNETPPPVYPDPPTEPKDGQQGYQQGPPPGYQQGPPPGYQSPPPGYQQGPPPGYQQGPPPGYQSPPPGYQQGPPPGYQGQQYYQGPPYGQYYANRPVGFIEAYKAYWKNAFDFNNRTSRAGYWWVFLMNIIIEIVVEIILTSGAVATGLSYGFMSDFSYTSYVGGFAALYVIYMIWSIANIIPGLSLFVRRMHDINKRWPWMFIALIPFVGWIILIVFLATAQKFPHENRFGYLPQV